MEKPNFYEECTLLGEDMNKTYRVVCAKLLRKQEHSSPILKLIEGEKEENKHTLKLCMAESHSGEFVNVTIKGINLLTGEIEVEHDYSYEEYISWESLYSLQDKALLLDRLILNLNQIK